ncbi:glycosyltransferase family 2 protein [Acetobacter indonesiensis]|uniref:glycosyltransferase family 2 protein n=1 Tax=Acetobacter indonesiensis TaxID=104101 RepID=UPI002351C97F|nr:glycosyltransferase family 2 protein [Acetobacter indonesiensis]
MYNNSNVFLDKKIENSISYQAEKLTIVVPCYNEQDVLQQAAAALEKQLDAMIEAGLVAAESHILFVDDGSRDDTWRLITELAGCSPMVQGLKLSRNVGHQNALLAGLAHVKDGPCISIDADLQDDVLTMSCMVEHYRQGCQVVYGIRQDRATDTLFKRNSAYLFYKVMALLGVDTIENHADFRLLGSAARQAVLSFTEENLYLRGIVPLVGFKTASVYYARKPRAAGESKYPLLKMLALAARGITSFSVVPLRMIAVLGVAVFLFGILHSIWSVIDKLFFQPAVGWASLSSLICIIGGLQMLALGVVGEYIGCIYTEVKRRPRYFVEQTL